MKVTATYDSATGKYTHTNGDWSNTRPIADLPGDIAFYKAQQERYPAHASTYEDDLRALEALARQLAQAGSPS